MKIKKCKYRNLPVVESNNVSNPADVGIFQTIPNWQPFWTVQWKRQFIDEYVFRVKFITEKVFINDSGELLDGHN